MRFYQSESHQVFYVSINDLTPFKIRPKAVEASTPEIELACKTPEVFSEELLFEDADGISDPKALALALQRSVSISDDEPTLIIHDLSEKQRMTSFKVY